MAPSEQAPKPFLSEDEKNRVLDKALDILRAADVDFDKWPAKPERADFLLATFDVLANGVKTEMKLRLWLKFDEHGWTSYQFVAESDPPSYGGISVLAGDLSGIWKQLDGKATPI